MALDTPDDLSRIVPPADEAPEGTRMVPERGGSQDLERSRRAGVSAGRSSQTVDV